jgi:hypothetical protein
VPPDRDHVRQAGATWQRAVETPMEPEVLHAVQKIIRMQPYRGIAVLSLFLTREQTASVAHLLATHENPDSGAFGRLLEISVYRIEDLDGKTTPGVVEADSLDGVAFTFVEYET